ncbi:hypothetical protein ACHAWF_003382 [Thalassiosira exigua]
MSLIVEFPPSPSPSSGHLRVAQLGGAHRGPVERVQERTVVLEARNGGLQARLQGRVREERRSDVVPQVARGIGRRPLGRGPPGARGRHELLPRLGEQLGSIDRAPNSDDSKDDVGGRSARAAMAAKGGRVRPGIFRGFVGAAIGVVEGEGACDRTPPRGEISAQCRLSETNERNDIEAFCTQYAAHSC